MSPGAAARVALALCALALSVGARPAWGAQPPCLAVSIPPQAWLAERLAGELPFAIEIVVPPGSSPATYDPGARQLARLASCEALVSAGVPFEKALFPRLAVRFPDLRLVDGLEGIELRDFDGPAHDHGEGSCHPGRDPHFWLDPKLAARHASLIARELVRMAPEHAAAIRESERELAVTLAELDADLTRILAPLEGRSVAVYHPSFGYLFGRYGIRQIAIEQEGRDPGPRRLAEIVRGLRDAAVRIVVLQPEFSSRSARRVAESVGVPTITLDPLSRDYESELRRMARLIADAIEKE